MPSAGGPRSWRWLGKLLPRSLRELVYEPLCDDLWREHVERAAGGRLGLRPWLQLIGYFVATATYSLPRYFSEGGHLTKLGRAAAVVGVGATLFMVVMLAPWIVWVASQL